MMDFDQTISMARSAASTEELHIEALKSFLYQSPALVFIKDYSGDSGLGVYTFVSREWERTYGFKKAQIVGKTDFDFFPKPDADKARLNDIHTLEFARAVTVMDMNGTRYSGWKPIKMNLIPMKIGPGDRWNYIAGVNLPTVQNHE